MAQARKTKSSKVAKKVVPVLTAPPKPKKKAKPKEPTDHETCDDISSSLWIVERNVFDQAREKVGHDLPKIREEVLRMEKETQQNYGNITGEIDKYNKISE